MADQPRMNRRAFFQGAACLVAATSVPATVLATAPDTVLIPLPIKPYTLRLVETDRDIRARQLIFHFEASRDEWPDTLYSEVYVNYDLLEEFDRCDPQNPSDNDVATIFQRVKERCDLEVGEIDAGLCNPWGEQGDD